MKISNRLKRVASYVEDNSFVLDIGCDHGLLAIFLQQTKTNIKIIASDINLKPLNQARENIKLYQAKNIILKQANGMDAYEEGIDTVILSGLGTSTILDILLTDKDKLKEVNKIIIASNNDYYKLRKTMNDNGFYILDESVILEKNKFYPIIVFIKGHKKYNYMQLKYGPILLKTNDETMKKFILYSLNKLLEINKQLPKTQIIKIIKNLIEIKALRKML